MQQVIREIASRVREMRDVSDISIDDLAGSIGVSVDEYQAYEDGVKDIPASVLYAIASVLKVDMSIFLTGEEPRMKMYSVTRKGKGTSVQRRAAYKYESLAANFAHARMEPFIVTVEPKDERPKTNAHQGQEFNYVLSGRVQVVIGGHEIILEAGDSIYFDSGNDHSMAAMDGCSATFLAIIL